MFDWIFGPRDPLVKLSRGTDRRAFIEALGRSGLVILSLPLNQGPDPWTMTQEELLARIEANAKDLAECKEFTPFTYPHEGKRCMPLFSSLSLAEVFIREYMKEVNRILSFQAFTLAGLSLRDALLSAEQVVLNARTRHERLLVPEDLKRIAETWS